MSTLNKKISEKDEVVVRIGELLDSHIKTVNAIVEDYVGGPGMETEIEAAHENLRIEITEILEDKQEESFDDLLEKVFDHDDFWEKKFFEKLDSDSMAKYVSENKGYSLIRVDSLSDKMKLEEFVKTEIYPDYNEQKGNCWI